MTRPVAILTVAALAMLAAGHPPARADDNEQLVAHWGLEPEATSSHPKVQKLALVAPAAVDLARCRLTYVHARSHGDAEYPDLANGGKIVVKLQRVGEQRTVKVVKGKGKVAVTGEERDVREAAVAWADSLVQDDPAYKHSGKFPLHLESGEMLLWTVKFRGMPRLEEERERESWFLDLAEVFAECWTCGTDESPCPDDQ